MQDAFEKYRYGSAALLALYNSLMANRLGYALVGRALPALLFSLILTAKGLALQKLLAGGAGSRDSVDLLTYCTLVAYETLQMIFLATICLLFVIRQPIVRGLTSFRSAAVALAGTFMSTPLLFAPTSISDTRLILVADLVMALGTALSVFSLLHLGRCFGISPQARGLVTVGPYGWVRHPLYLSEEVTTLGILLPKIGLITVAIFLIHCLLQFRRATSEEAILADAFPQYHSYRTQVSRFVPRLY